MFRTLGAFHHRVDYRMTRQKKQKRAYEGLFYPPLEEAMQEEGLDTTKTYITWCQKKIAQYIATPTILELCLKTERQPGEREPKRWQEQGGLDWEGAREAEGGEYSAGMDTEEVGEEREEYAHVK